MKKKKERSNNWFKILFLFIFIVVLIISIFLLLKQKNVSFSPKCLDSDAGVNPYLTGITSSGKESKEDFCYSEKTVEEYYCSGSKIAHKEYECNAKQICSDGKCISGINLNQPVKCQDSDGGLNLEVRGTLTFCNSIDCVKVMDNCFDNVLKEYYCSSDEEIFLSKNYECKNGCLNGICIKDGK